MARLLKGAFRAALVPAILATLVSAAAGRSDLNHHRYARHRQHHARRHSARPAGASKQCAGADTPDSGANAGLMRAAVLCLVNEERAAHHLPALRNNGRLDRSAQAWSEHMVAAGDFSHGTAFAARLAAVGYNWAAAGENIATGYPTPRQVVLAWMASPEHCQNILTPSYRDLGTGVVDSPVAGAASGPATWTQDFGLKMGAAPPSGNWGPANGCPYSS
jgi:uncharacterized protein YkwD